MLGISATHAKNVAELHHAEAGFYRLMQGIILGLFTGFLLSSPTVVLIVAIAANAAAYRYRAKGPCSVVPYSHKATRFGKIAQPLINRAHQALAPWSVYSNTAFPPLYILIEYNTLYLRRQL